MRDALPEADDGIAPQEPNSSMMSLFTGTDDGVSSDASLADALRKTGKENDEESQRDNLDNKVADSGLPFDHFDFKHTVRAPGAPKLPNCPVSDCFPTTVFEVKEVGIK